MWPFPNPNHINSHLFPPQLNSKTNQKDLPQLKKMSPHINPNASHISINKLSINQATIQKKLTQTIQQHKQTNFTLQDWQQIEDSIKSMQTRQTMQGIIGLQNLLNNSNVYKELSQKVIDCGMMPYLINLLGQLDYPQLQCYALKVLSHLSYGTDKECKEIVQSGGVSFIMQIINDIKDQCSIIDVIRIWGNLAAEKSLYRNLLINSDAITKLIEIVARWSESQSIKVIQDAVCWAVSNICWESSLLTYESIKQGLDFLCQKLVDEKINDKNSLKSCMWAMSLHGQYFKTICSPSQISKLLEKIDQLMKTPQKQIYVQSIRTLQHLIQAHPQACQKYILNAAIKFISKNLKNTSKSIRLDTILFVKAILEKYAYSQQVQIVFLYMKVMNKLANESFVELLVNVFANDPVEGKTVICQVLLQIVGMNKHLQLLKLLHKLLVIKHLIKSLSSPHRPLVISALKCLHKLFQTSELTVEETKQNLLMNDFINENGTHVVESLQMHPDEKIYEKAFQLIQQFFETQEEQKV